MEVRVLGPRDAQALWNLRCQALESEPQAFGESLSEHRRTNPDTYMKRLQAGGPENFVLGAFRDGDLIGMAGFYREQRIKRRHKGWIWGVFVLPEARGHGVGCTLLTKLVEQARAIPGLRSILLSVSTTQESARRRYLSLGFRSFGVEPRSLEVNGRLIDEEHMILELPA
jgi:RimJ/RimL family protein N-acetyltransferase